METTNDRFAYWTTALGTATMTDTTITTPITPTRTTFDVSALIGAPAVSIVVLVTFGVVIGLAVSRTLPDSNGVMMLIGALVSMATTVVGYWCGSSAGSKSKDDTIANNSVMLANSTPNVVPLHTLQGPTS